MVVKFQCDEEGKFTDVHYMSERVIEDMLRVHTVSDEMILVFHSKNLIVRNGKLQ